ncbi:medium-chain dehydrogenase/reductase like protein [Trametopsis cervina]|nr:medium-chain dehydrogenase/reductase like protein [Trametopsis cervina]
MSTHKALFLLERRGSYAVREIETPEPAAGELLVEVHATGLNPVDWKIQSFLDFICPTYPAIVGADSAGIVKAVGEGVTSFVVGDKVVHQGFYRNRQATFQQYTIVPAEITAKLPPNLSFDQAATIPLALATAAFGFYSKKATLPARGGAELAPVWEEGGRGKYAGQPILIIGGSSSVGQQAIQFAKLSGFSPIITTASKHNEAFVKSLGATHIVDRNEPLPQTVQSITSEPIKIIYDAISLKDTQNDAYDILAPGGTLVLVEDLAIDESKLTKDKELVAAYGTVYDPNQRALGVSLYKNLTAMLESGELKPNNVEVVPNGLAGIPDALEKLKAGKVSASKLVAHPQE